MEKNSNAIGINIFCVNVQSWALIEFLNRNLTLNRTVFILKTPLTVKKNIDIIFKSRLRHFKGESEDILKSSFYRFRIKKGNYNFFFENGCVFNKNKNKNKIKHKQQASKHESGCGTQKNYVCCILIATLPPSVQHNALWTLRICFRLCWNKNSSTSCDINIWLLKKIKRQHQKKQLDNSSFLIGTEYTVNLENRSDVNLLISSDSKRLSRVKCKN